MPLDPARLEVFLTPDGACRDINVAEAVPRATALGLLAFVAGRWTLASATDREGESLADVDSLGRYLQRRSGTTRSVWNSTGFIRQVQVYFHWTNAQDVFFELSFFPEDVDRATLDAAGFDAFLRDLMHASGAGELYVRDENASWRHGDSALEAGVFRSHRDLAQH